MRALIVHASNNTAHEYGGPVIKRAIDFNKKHGIKCEPQALFAELSYQMCVDQPNTLCLACVDDDLVRGHCIVHLQELYGYRTAMVYHLEIDQDARDDTRKAMLEEGWNHIENWARAMGCGAIRTWAMNDKLAVVFSKFGLEAEPHALLEKKLE